MSQVFLKEFTSIAIYFTSHGTCSLATNKPKVRNYVGFRTHSNSVFFYHKTLKVCDTPAPAWNVHVPVYLK